MPRPGKKRAKSKRINLNSRERWEKIIGEVEKNKIPITLIESIIVNLIDGTRVPIEIRQLLDDGYDAKELEQLLEKKLTQLDDYIQDIDFFVNVDDVAKTIQPITDSFLKDL